MGGLELKKLPLFSRIMELQSDGVGSEASKMFNCQQKARRAKEEELRSGNVLPPPADEYCINSSVSSGKPISQSASNENSAQECRYSNWGRGINRFSTAVAFEEPITSPVKLFQERSRIMLRFADLLEKHSDNIAALETWDNGNRLQMKKYHWCVLWLKKTSTLPLHRLRIHALSASDLFFKNPIWINVSISFATIALYIGPKWLLTSILAHLHLLSVLYASAFFSEAHKYRLQCYYIEPVTLRSLNDKFIVSRYWKARKYLQRNQWLQTWLRREIQALIQEEDVEIIIHHILGVIDSFRRNDQKSPTTPEAKQEHFKALVSQAATPFLIGRTDRFVNEVELFLASGLNIDAYDKVYMQHLGWKVSGITTEDEEGEVSGNAPSVPYLFLFDEDSDGIE
ncbi:unnamed protein product [Camellia sinensis]